MEKTAKEERNQRREALGIPLTKENFEEAISDYLEKQEIVDLFISDGDEMDEFCRANYHGMTFTEAYNALMKQALKVGNELIKDVAGRGNGNSTAIQLMNQYFLKRQQLDDASTLRIVIKSDTGDGKDDK
jgi:outer membrane protein assembly factor BamE (lipoprotein component of BamABCDE complex)